MLTSHSLKSVLFACLLIVAIGCDSEPANTAARESHSKSEKPSNLNLTKSTLDERLESSANALPTTNYPSLVVADNAPAIPTLEGPLGNHQLDVKANALSPSGKAISSSETKQVSPAREDPDTAASKALEDGFTEEKLHKNFTLFLLASEPDVRARKLMMYLREYLTADQWDEGIEMLLKYDSEFQALKIKRAEILSTATDGDDTEAKLRQIKIETVKIADRLRILVYKKVLTHEQKVLRDKRVAEVRAEAKAEAESRAAKKVEQTQAR